MSRRRYILLWFLSLTGAVAVFLAATVLLAPLYLNSAPIKQKIVESLSRELKTPVGYDRLDVAWFPLPSVIATNARIAVADTVSGTAASIAFYPQIVPLLKGNFLLSKVRLSRPRVMMTLRKETEQTASLSLDAVKRNIAELFVSLNSFAPGLVLLVDDGSTALVQERRRTVSLESINARFTALPAGVEMKLHATSSVWGPVALAGTWTFDLAGADIRGVSGTLGHSSLAGLSARLDWRNEARLDISSGSALFAIDELYQWLHSFDFPAPLLTDIGNLRGSVTVSSLTAGGPLSRPEDWRFNAAGLIENVAIESPLLPGPLSVASQFSVDQDQVELREFRAVMGKSSFSRVSLKVNWRNPARITVRSAATVLDLGEFARWRTGAALLQKYAGAVNTLGGTVRLSSFTFSGPLMAPLQWNVTAAGVVEQVALDARPLPAQLSITRGAFDASPRTLSFRNAEATMGDTALRLSGSLAGPLTKPIAVDFSGKGTIGKEGLAWAYAHFGLQETLLLRTPLTFSHIHLSWKNVPFLSLAGSFSSPDGLNAELDLQARPGELVITKSTVVDGDSNASLALHRSDHELTASFSGTLSYRTLDRLFQRPITDSGMLRGKLQISLPRDRADEMSAEGNLEGEALVVAGIPGPPLTIERFALHAADGVFSIDSAELSREHRRYNLSGTVTPSAAGFTIDGDLKAETLDVNALRELLTQKTAAPAPAGSSLYGVMRVDADSMIFGPFDFRALRGFVARDQDRVSATITNSGVCGISVVGTVALARDEIIVDAKSAATRQEVEKTLACFAGKDVHLTGTFDLQSELHAQGPANAWLRELDGAVNITAKDGKIYRYPLLARIFSVLSVTEILRGKVPELGESGFPYHTITIHGTVHKGIVKLDRFLMEGATLDIIAEGYIDLAGKKIDAVVLVAPFSTVNWIIRHIPLVGKIMGGTLVSVPVKVSGDLADPAVTFLAPSAVGTRMLEILENIVKIPVEIISPLLPSDKKKDEVPALEKPIP